MHRIDVSTAAASLPSPAAAGTPGYFTEGNPASGTPATEVSADFLNAVQEELISVILAGGGTPTKGTNDQVLAAINALISGAVSVALPFKYKEGGRLSPNPGAPGTALDISPCARLSEDGTTGMFQAATYTKQINAAWAEGSGVGGWPTGITLTANTMVGVFQIGKADGTADYGFDTSNAANNLLADAAADGYTKYRRIGYVWIYDNGGTLEIRPFRQNGNQFLYDAPFERAAWTLATTAANLEVAAPPDTIALLSFELAAQAASSVYTVVRHPDAADVAASPTSYTFILGAPGGVSTQSSFRVECPTNSSSEVAVRSFGPGTALAVMSLGWIDAAAA